VAGKPARTFELNAHLLVGAVGMVFLLFHLPFIAPGAGSVDTMNFALAVQEFDVSEHRPHPPGYPVFVALGKMTSALTAGVPAEADSVRHEARALAAWSAMFGALVVFPLFTIFRCLDRNDRRAAAATIVSVTCPLFWFMAVRPMSDVPGLGAALMVQALLFSAYRAQQRQRWRTAMRLLLAGAVASGVAVGLRSQTLWLTLPLLIVIAFRQIRVADRPVGSTMTLLNALALGVALWGIPMVAASGGPRAYQAALVAQAAEDFADVPMLYQDPSPGRLVTGLVSTIAHPWADKFLAGAVLLLALIGVVVLARRSRSVLGWVTLAVAPYAVFHLLFQDPSLTRYALPATPFVAYLAIRGLDALSGRLVLWGTIALALGGVAVAGGPVVAYATSGSATHQAITEVRRALSADPEVSPVLGAHHGVVRAIRGETLGARQLPSPRRHEWLEVVRYWREGGTGPVWFLADSARTDLALIDPTSYELRGEFRLPFGNRFLMSGARPQGVDWVEMRQPGWMAGRGWALTPETAGVAWRESQAPGLAPVSAWIRRRAEAAVLVMGGRNLGRVGEPDVRFAIRLEGRVLDVWTVAPDPGFFLRTVTLPAGLLDGAGNYAELTVTAHPSDGVIRSVNAAIEQFDVQSADRPVFGFGDGWYHPEYDAAANKLWRWTGPWARLRVHHGDHDLTLRLAGDSPLKYLDSVPSLTLRAGDRMLGRLVPSDQFVWDVPVPADALNRSEGELTLETDITFVPDERLHNGDRRPLGLRIFDVSLSVAKR
jgi:hypothetical protein